MKIYKYRYKIIGMNIYQTKCNIDIGSYYKNDLKMCALGF